MPQHVPLIVEIPTVLGNGLVRITMGTELRIHEVSGNLFALTTGPHTIRVRRSGDNTVLGSITWNAAGAQVFTGVDEYVGDNEGLLFDTTAAGTGAQFCTVALWGIVPGT